MEKIFFNYIAHYCLEDGREQTLREHLEGTALRAQMFAEPFNAGDLAWACGFLHDFGKYSERFQRRIRGEKIKADHSSPGGQFIYKQNEGTHLAKLAKLISYCIMGHHGKGLPDCGSESDNDSEPTLQGRLQKQVPDCSAFFTECNLPVLIPPRIPIIDGFSAAFFTRMIFAALVDADYLNTEEFFHKGNAPRGGFAGIAELEQKLHFHIQTLLHSDNTGDSLNALRNELLKSCLEAANEDSGLFTLTAPTGSGKTIASLAFALNHAVCRGKRRVIYIVPYNTIIEQNAAVFESILGAENVLQHHSNVQYGVSDEDNQYSEEENQKRYSTENWDYPLIVTSSVQFFESLFSAKPGKCRRLHNLSNSVLIFDEAQMIPLPYLIPCTRAIQELVQNYSCTAVLATATQSAIENYFGSVKAKEITKEPRKMYESLKRTSLVLLAEPFSECNLVEHLLAHPRVLCIVNSRKLSQGIYAQLKNLEAIGTFHLSTTMYPAHRSKVLKEIRTRLEDPENQFCRVISTSLVEAGVDLDFPVVYREEAGLDSIIQAAGRCNREGKQPATSSYVYVFRLTEHRIPAPQQVNVATFKQIARFYYDNLDATDAIHAYFEQLFCNKGEAALDEKSIILKLNQGLKAFDFPFRTIADKFKLIEQNIISIYILKDNPGLEKRLRSGERNRALFREMGQYTVSLYDNDVSALRELGQIEYLDEETLLLPEIFYDEGFGINLLPKGGGAVFLEG